MAVLESCPKYNMVAYLEKTDGNAEFHEIIDFLARSSIHNALTLKSVPVPLDYFPVNALTSKVFSFMVKKGKHFSGKVTPLFSNMLVQPTEDEGEQSERPSEPQLTPSPPHPSEVHVEPQSDPSPRPSPTTHIPDSIPESLVGIQEVTDQAKQIKQLKAQIKKLKKKAKHCIKKESVSKQGRKPAKAEPLVHKDPLFDELADDTLDYMDTENAQDMGRTRFVVHEEKEREEKEVSTDDALGTDKEKVSTDKEKDSTDKEKDSTDKEKDSTDRPDEGTEGRSATPTTPTPTPTTFGDDETIAQVLLNMSQAKAVSREKEKGVELKDVENIERPRLTSTRSLLTLKSLPKIDPKDKGKKKIKEDESDTESEDINETEKKFKMLAHDEEIARKMQEDWETEEERKRLAEEEATNAALIQDFDDIKARMEADRLLALRLQEEEREQFTVEERAKFLHDTIAAQRSFTAVGSTEDERKIKEMNEGAKDLKQKRLKKVAKETPKKEDTVKVPAKVDVTEQGIKKRKGGHMKMLARKRKRPQSDVDSDDEHIKCLKIITFEGTIDSEIMERKSVITRLNKVSSPDGDYLVIYRANGNFRAFNYLLEEIVTWRLYEACGVYILELEDGTIIHMLVERRVLNSPCFMVKSWLVQDQTVLGKDYSNLLIADSLLTIWFINAPCYGNEALASPKANGIWISSISIGSSNVQPSEFPYLPVLCIGTSQSRQHDKSESVFQKLSVNSLTGTSLIHKELKHRCFPFVTSLIHSGSHMITTKTCYVGFKKIPSSIAILSNHSDVLAIPQDNA
ncbi:hypothetical protein Tco_0046902 [Tanacetum coccineum]